MFLIEDFLSDEEVYHLQAIGVARLQPIPKTPVSEALGVSGLGRLDRAQDPVVAGIESRLSNWTLMPAGNAEGFNFFMYEARPYKVSVKAHLDGYVNK